MPGVVRIANFARHFQSLIKLGYTLQDNLFHSLRIKLILKHKVNWTFYYFFVKRFYLFLFIRAISFYFNELISQLSLMISQRARSLKSFKLKQTQKYLCTNFHAKKFNFTFILSFLTLT